MNVLIVDDDKLARKGLVAIMDWTAVLPQAVSAIAAASSRAVILVIFMDLLPSYNKKYRCIFKTTTVLYQILW